MLICLNKLNDVDIRLKNSRNTLATSRSDGEFYFFLPLENVGYLEGSKGRGVKLVFSKNGYHFKFEKFLNI